MGIVSLVLMSVGSGAVRAQARDTLPLLPLDQLLARPRITSVQINPAGTTLAVLEQVGSHPAVVLYTRDRRRLGVVFRDTVRSVSNVRWSGDGRWLLVLHDRGGDEGYHMLRVDPHRVDAADVSVATDLTPFPGAEVELLATPPSGASAIIASNHRDRRVSDVYSVDLTSGALTRLATNPGDVTVWAVTPQGAIGAASAVLANGTLEVRTRRPAPDTGWRVIYRAPPAERFTLLSAEDGAGAVVGRSNAGSSFEAFVRLAGQGTGVIARTASSCTGFDAGTHVTSLDGRMLGESCATAQRTFVHQSPVVQRRLRTALVALDRSLDARNRSPTLRALEYESSSVGGETLVFYSHAATDPGRFVLYDTRTGVAEAAFEMRPEIDRAVLAPTSFHWFTARDGLRLSMLVTRSQLHPASRQPAVVVVHGGPWARDEVGFSGETQLLANRGYTVLQVNFRGSTGLGKATVDGAVGEFGGRMSDDLLDGIRWAAREARVDSSRVCILGGSYGGFAALVGMTRDAARYRCGIDYAGPFDLETLVRAFPASWQPFLPRSWYRFVGDPADSSARARMRLASPLSQLDKAHGPLLVFHGVNDPRVRTDHALRVVQAWRARNLPVSLLLAANEGHSFNEASTSLAVNRAVELFLGEWLGGRVQPTVDSSISTRLQQLRAAGDSASRVSSAPRN